MQQVMEGREIFCGQILKFRLRPIHIPDSEFDLPAERSFGEHLI